MQKKVDIMWKYVIFTYFLFWGMVILIGGTASIIYKVSPLTMRWIANLCAWSPTFAFLIMFKKLKPRESLKDFYIQIFKDKLQISLLMGSGIVIIGGIIVSVWILSHISQKSFYTFFSPSAFSLPLTIVLSLLSGPTGEETGWRGYLNTELNQKYGFLKGSIFGGVIWAFWHAVLWFIDADFQGWALLIYILSNVIVMTSLVIIMNFVLERSNNLLNAVWIHFCFNIVYVFLKVDIVFFIILSVIYSIIGIIVIFIRSKFCKRSSVI